LKSTIPDIITLQETHASESRVQAKEIAMKLGMSYYYNDDHDDSHLEKGQKLGLAVISRFPLSGHNFELFYNPKYKWHRPNGEVWISHNKGITSCTAEIDEVKLKLQTLHLIPFRKFGVDIISDETKDIRDDISLKITKDYAPYLLQGDFNFNDESLKAFLPAIFSDGLQELDQEKPTTPKGRIYDHILYQGLELKKYNIIDDVLTDHFPIISKFELT